MRPITKTYTPAAASATVIAAPQTIGAAGNLVLTAAAGTGIDSSGIARIVLFTTTENDSAVNYTITGTDADGNVITEGPTALPSSSTKSSALAYKTITSIAVSAAIAANISVGTTNATLSAITPTIILDYYAPGGTTVIIEVTGTIVYTVRETFDPILSSATSSAIWFSGSLNNATQNTSGGGTVGANLVSVSSANSRSMLDTGTTGLDISIASYTTGATLTVQVITPSYRG